MPGALIAPPHGREVRRVLREHELGVPLTPVLGRVIEAGKPAQIAVERRDFILLAHGLQAGVEHDVGELQAARVEFGHVAPAQVEGQRAAIELVRAADQRTRLLHVLAGLLGRQRFADRLLAQVVQMCFQGVLRRGDQRQAHHGVLGHLVEQRVARIAAFARFPGEMPGCRRRAQPVEHHDPMRHVIEEPDAIRHVGTRLAEEQAVERSPCRWRVRRRLLPLLRGRRSIGRSARDRQPSRPARSGSG